MAQELKLHLTDPQAIETKLQSLGATFIDETNFTDTYFNQPDGEVFKITYNNKGYFLIQLKRTPQGTFETIKNQKIDNADDVKAEMGNEYGIKCVLEGKRKNYSLDDLTITINLINQRGAFLIITGENPTKDFVTQKLGLTNPEYITVPFDQLPLTSFTIPTQ
jgi:adenylate cyclase class IV